MSETDDLTDRIRSEANIADRPGQLDRLNRIADEVDAALIAVVRVNERLMNQRAALRAQVVALAGRNAYVRGHTTVWLHDVLDLIDGGSHDAQ